MAGKQLSYEDLLISSKFFYTEGSDEAERSLPEETKQCRESDLDRQQESNFGLGGDHDAALCYQETGSRQMRSTVLDVDVAMEAACGDPTFLVSKSRRV